MLVEKDKAGMMGGKDGIEKWGRELFLGVHFNEVYAEITILKALTAVWI